MMRQPRHRFFFSPDEVLPPHEREDHRSHAWATFSSGMTVSAVEVAASLIRRQLADGVTVKDFGIRGFDLAYALLDPWDLVVIVDALAHGEAPGTLYVQSEPDRSGSGYIDQPARHGSSTGTEPGCFYGHDFRAGTGVGLRTASTLAMSSKAG